jgi:plasmid maintenance system antidote protein VapI
VDKVKKLMHAGMSLSAAIKEALGMSITGFADKYSMHRSITSEVINLDRAPRLEQCTALAKELGGSPFEWAELLWEHSRPREDAFSATA